ncbi:MAG TPA: DUF2490 domain-containing protein [Chitinophagaceae bacterium]|nr:DUF2490 domain-containing protein [Chitinophagaceae bacterium]
MKKLFILIACFSTKNLLAQVPSTASWFSFQFRLNKAKWELINDGGYRTIGMSASCYAYYYRNGLRYKLNDNWSVAAGSAFFFTRSSYQKSNHGFGKEFRLWQDAIFRKPIWKTFAINNRFRIEERWFNRVNNKPAYFGFRPRERLTISKMLSEKWSLELGDEYLRMLSDNKFTFNSNRILLFATYTMKKQTQLQGGYIWLKLPAASQHVFTINFQKTITLHKHGQKEKHT